MTENFFQMMLKDANVCDGLLSVRLRQIFIVNFQFDKKSAEAEVNEDKLMRFKLLECFVRIAVEYQHEISDVPSASTSSRLPRARAAKEARLDPDPSTRTGCTRGRRQRAQGAAKPLRMVYDMLDDQPDRGQAAPRPRGVVQTASDCGLLSGDVTAPRRGSRSSSKMVVADEVKNRSKVMFLSWVTPRGALPHHRLRRCHRPGPQGVGLGPLASADRGPEDIMPEDKLEGRRRPPAGRSAAAVRRVRRAQDAPPRRRAHDLADARAALDPEQGQTRARREARVAAAVLRAADAVS